MNSRAESEWIKQRCLQLGPGNLPLVDLARRLIPMEGLLLVTPVANDTLSLRYNLQRINLHQLLQRVAQLDCHPAAGWQQSLRLRLWQYQEQCQQDNRGQSLGWKRCVRQIYISRHRSRRHGRIDDRPQQWRRYLDRDR